MLRLNKSAYFKTGVTEWQAGSHFLERKVSKLGKKETHLEISLKHGMKKVIWSNKTKVEHFGHVSQRCLVQYKTIKKKTNTKRKHCT